MPTFKLNIFGECVEGITYNEWVASRGRYIFLVKKIDTFLEIVQNISDELARSKNSISSVTTSQSRTLLKQVIFNILINLVW